MAKLSEKEFLHALRESAGLYARTVKYIKKHHKQDITRQAVRERALKHPKVLEDIQEQNLDVAEEGLHSLMRSRNERIKFRACDAYLQYQGKKRGYTKRVEVDAPVDNQPFRSDPTPIEFEDEEGDG